jgi:predicted TIM-barrel fold metal-dependent hydrolase
MKPSRAGWLFVAPALMAIAVFFVVPVAAALLMSATDFDIYALADLRNVRFIGLGNYRQLLQTPLFWRALLNTLFNDYPDLRFDIFHIGYPYWEKLGVLCKMYPNVFIDMCWAHIVAPERSRVALSAFLDSVPRNKICAFGGDYFLADLVYGHQLIARENVAAVLADKVKAGIFDVDEAIYTADLLLHDNAITLFGLDAR